VIRTLVVVVLGSLLAGCTLDRPYPDKSYYALTAPDLGRLESAGARSIRVPRARLAAPFGSRSIQYRVGPDQYERDYYESWADDPGELISAATINALATTGAFTAVVPGGSSAAGTETLELFVTSLYADVSVPGATNAVLRIRATLLDGDRAVILSREYGAEVPVGSSDATSVVGAWNASLETILRQLAADLISVGQTT
jgi:ABC-type uncharacterized transport system auxiliary subunit